nr:putative F-box/FBD/LRR-repeat protein At4g03220 isoform X2 [Malus domestica]
MSDRITDLPDWVAYHILSFLAVTDLTRFGCVSKRCRQLYLSTPSLNFDGFPDAHIVSCEKRLELLSSLDRFLLMYRGVNNIQRFRIYWDDLLLNASSSFRQDAVFRMMTWIHNAVSCNVEVLEIFVHIIIDPPRTLLPSSVFLCRSLRSLSISMCYNILKSPSLTSSSNLECLTLSSVTIEDEEIFKWISCSCKCIKELHLENVSGSSVTIESSSLRLFSFLNPNHSSRYCNLSISGEKLEEILIDWGFDSTCSKLLNIHAPNLKYLKWLGNLLFHQNFGKLMCLKKAELFLKPKADDYSLSSEVLCIINSAEALILSKEITMCCGFNMGYWRLQNFPFIHQLKEVTIELSNGSNGVQFAKYILEHAGNLKEMKVVYSLEQSKAIAKLKKSKRASKIATVVFEEDKFRMSIRRSFHL